MKTKKVLLSLSLTALFSLTSCFNKGDNLYSLKEHIVFQKPNIVYCKTEVAFPETREYYEQNIATVNETDTIDGNFRAIATNVNIIDGDTVHLNLPTTTGTKLFKIRYANVNTPELHHPSNGCDPWGLAAKQYLQVLLEDAKKNNLPVVVESPTEDGKFEDASFDRYLGYVWIGEHLTNIDLVEIGLGTLEHANDSGGDGYKYRHDAIARKADAVRLNIERYPTGFNYGVLDFKPVSGLQGNDPNWDASKDNGKDQESNPAIINQNYKYNFDFELSGLKSELKICIDHPDLCE